MATTLSQEDLIAAWENFFRDYYKAEIERAALDWPETRSVVVDYKYIDMRDLHLAEHVLEKPTAALYAAELALRQMDVPVDPKPKLHFRIRNLPETARVGIRDLRSAHLSRLVAVEGLIKKATEVRPKLETAVFKCSLCGNVFKVFQDDQLVQDPEVCPEEQGGCGRAGKFKLLTTESKFVDHQKIEIQESPEGLRGGAQPQKISIYLMDDLVGEVSPGDRVIVNGTLVAQVRRQGSLKYTDFNKVMDAVSIEQQELEYEEVEISDEDEARILALSKDPELYKKMVASFAPVIFGLDKEKEALILSLFSGIAKHYPDGTRVRGDIHVLLVGDPGVAKSQLLRYMANLAPRSIYTSGKSSSAAGLTAAAVRDEFGEGQWTLEAGALVLADMGIACVDEMDKMEKHDQSALHQAMEQQEVSVAKAGITATLKSRCAVIGAANPKLGRFDDFTSVHEQINMPPALMSRFDLVFSIRDKPSREQDTKLATHILGTHKAGEILEHRRVRPDGRYTVEDEESFLKRVEPPLEPEFLRKFVAYAKRNIYPVIDDDALEYIKEFYVDLRNQNTDSVPFTARQLEAFVRLAEASARVRLSEAATIDDAMRAIDVVRHFLTQMAMDTETGRIDIDIVATGASHSQRDRMRQMIEIVKRLAGASEQGMADRRDVINEAERAGIPTDKAEGALEQLKKVGQIYEPKPGRFRST